MASEVPEYNDKIIDAYLLGPAAYMSHANNIIFKIAEFADDLNILLHLLGQWEFLPHSDFMTWLGHFICNVQDHPIYGGACENFVFLLFGINPEQLNA